MGRTRLPPTACDRKRRTGRLAFIHPVIRRLEGGSECAPHVHPAVMPPSRPQGVCGENVHDVHSKFRRAVAGMAAPADSR